MSDDKARHRIAESLTLSKLSAAGVAEFTTTKLVEQKRPSRIAVFVTHGMGQQAPFETLDLVAQGLIGAAGTITTSGVAARTVRSGGLDLQRLEFGIRDHNGGDALVHVYEAYWAPLTEGQVTLKDVTGFLFAAGWNGIRNAFTDFKGWMFGHSVIRPALHISLRTQLCAIASSLSWKCGALHHAVGVFERFESGG